MKIHVVLLAGLFGATTATAQWSADRVLGQPALNTRNPASGPGPALPFTASSLNGPGGVAVSPTTGKVFVADYFNNRVTRYASAATLASGAAAEDFVNLGTGVAWSIFVDALDSLWIADVATGRIYRYAGASTATLSVNFANVTLSTAGCEYLTVDANGTLWVTYGANSPIVTWLAGATTITSPVPVLTPAWTGTLKFTNKPQLGGVAVAIVKNKPVLWLADANHSVVYRFDNPKNGQGQANVAAVLGQATLTSKGPQTGPAGLSYPRSLSVDFKGRLWVADTAKDDGSKNANRLLRWDKAATLRTGAAANAIIGQGDFFAKKSGVGAKLIAPFRGGIALDATGAVWFADDFNNRVLHYTPERVKPGLTIRGFRAASTTTSKSALVQGKATDASGVALVQYRLNGKPAVAAKGTTKWKFNANYVKGANRVQVDAIDTQGNRTTVKFSVTVK